MKVAFICLNSRFSECTILKSILNGVNLEENFLEKGKKGFLKHIVFFFWSYMKFYHIPASRFDTDLMPRKSSIKVMIQEELTKLADEADDEDGEGGAEKDENQSAGQEVEA